MDWIKIISEVERTQAMDDDSLATFLDTLNDTNETTVISRLIRSSRSMDGFLATSVENDVDESALLPDDSKIGPWRIQGLIGRGGMADVYLAHRADGLYEQNAALKVIKSAAQNRASLFELERQRLAKLEHPSIARIIDGGTLDDSRPYMIIEYVKGHSIAEYLKHQQSSEEAVLRLFLKVCHAVDYAHSNFVLHRDIKSDNVLITEDGLPRLIDFGIASSLDDDSAYSSALTLSTAAPEQLKDEPVSIQTDVFSLGVLLHELLTRKRPNRRADAGMEIDTSAIKQPDLRAILEHALALDPNQRYPAVNALIEDLNAYLNYYPVSARKGGRMYKLRCFIQRNPLSTSLGSLAALSLIVGLFVSVKFANDASQQAQRAELALQRANWQFERNEATLAAQQAYSDVLQRAFGGEENTERLSTLLTSRWREAFDAREKDANTAAALSYAIGRNFYFRGDTASAITIFDTWMSEKIGPPALLAIGEEVYALMLYDAGRMDEASELLRKLVTTFGDGSLTSEADASNYAYRLARATRNPKDIAWSIQLLEGRLATLESPFERLFSFSQLAGLKTLLEDFDAAYFAYAETVRIMEENPSYASYGRDIARFNLASITLAWKDDYEKATALVEQILSEDVPLKGESLQLARALMLKAVIGVSQNESEVAVQLIDESIMLFERFSGLNSPLHILSQAMKAYVLHHAGQNTEAVNLLNQLASRIEKTDTNIRTISQIKLIQVYVSTNSREIQASELEWLKNTQLHEDVKGNLILLYIYKKLADKGYAPAFWHHSIT